MEVADSQYDATISDLQVMEFHYCENDLQQLILSRLVDFVILCEREGRDSYRGALEYAAKMIGMKSSTIRPYYKKVVDRFGKNPLAYKFSTDNEDDLF